MLRFIRRYRIGLCYAVSIACLGFLNFQLASLLTSGLMAAMPPQDRSLVGPSRVEKKLAAEERARSLRRAPADVIAMTMPEMPAVYLAAAMDQVEHWSIAPLEAILPETRPAHFRTARCITDCKAVASKPKPGRTVKAAAPRVRPQAYPRPVRVSALEEPARDVLHRNISAVPMTLR